MAQSEPIQVDLRTAIRVDFTPINEKWETYKLSDGTKLKVKLIITGVFRTEIYDPTTGEPAYAFNWQTPIVIVECPPNLKGEPSPQPITPEQAQKNVVEVVDFESTAKEENWNVYNLSDGSVLRAKLVITRIAKTSLYDVTGEPYYLVNGQQPIPNRIRVAKNLINKNKSNVKTDKSGPYL